MVEIIDDVEFTLMDNKDASVQIERVFIAEENRGKHLLSPALKKLVDRFDKKGVTLSCHICPDNYDDTDRLQICFVKAGFEPLKQNGETYRLDLSRTPQVCT